VGADALPLDLSSVVKVLVAVALALAALNAVPVIGTARIDADVAAQMRYCRTVEDPSAPYFCDPAAVRLDVETRPGTW
jgi:hypothetical protein